MAWHDMWCAVGIVIYKEKILYLLFKYLMFRLCIEFEILKEIF